ncbi:MAG: peptide chain release factor N(5)-glutamine methyltransferase [Lachnospiraceae bacterium]|nr:peptide chain release factor N(5)-glutamine methyltransferase [Lachnospiraceae bacterium]
MRYDELYQYGKNSLRSAGIDEADLDARLLLESITGLERNVLYAHPETEIEDEQVRLYRMAIEKREGRMPLQYITNTQSFMGLDFYVDEGVLIPRQDTEILVEEVLRESFDGMRILDICSGSGCILLSLLKYSNDTTGIGAELSEKALAVARQNAAGLGLEDRAEFVRSDLFESVEGEFDIIVSNPPYIKTDVIQELMPEVRDHEPVMALDGKDNGLYFYEKILENIGRHVLRGTRLYFEIGFDQGEEVAALTRQAGFSDVKVVKDYAGLDRVVFGIYGG